jgi:hypothetical protein
MAVRRLRISSTLLLYSSTVATNSASSGGNFTLGMRSPIYDFKNPADVIAWYRIWPKRHGEQLKWLAKHRPELAWSIKEAGRLLRS